MFICSGQRALNRNLCFELITLAFTTNNRFGMPVGHEIVYDCKAVMVTFLIFKRLKGRPQRLGFRFVSFCYLRFFTLHRK